MAAIRNQRLRNTGPGSARASTGLSRTKKFTKRLASAANKTNEANSKMEENSLTGISKQKLMTTTLSLTNAVSIDRTRVVKGKSVSGRVNHGCRGNKKKKNID